MNKKIILALAFLGLAFSASCKKKAEVGPAPVSIDQSTLTAEPLKVVKSIVYNKSNPWKEGSPLYHLVEKGGSVVLRWAIPEGADYERVEVKYAINDVLVKEDRMRYASVYESKYETLEDDKAKKVLDLGHTRIVVDNLKARYGEITFFLTPISSTGARGETISIKSSAKALALAPELKKDTRIREDIKADEIWTDSQEETEGPLKDLIDGSEKTIDGKKVWEPNTGTYFHMKWNGPTEFPHYIVVKLDKPAIGVSFDYIGRDKGNDNPKHVQVWGSQNFNGKFEPADGSDKFNPSDFGAKAVGGEQTFTAEKALAKGSSELLALGDEPATYIWLQFKDCMEKKNKWIALSNLNIYTYEVVWTDPERDGLSQAQIDELVAKGLLRSDAEIEKIKQGLLGE